MKRPAIHNTHPQSARKAEPHFFTKNDNDAVPRKPFFSSAPSTSLQRFISCDPADCSQLEPGEFERSKGTPHHVEIFEQDTASEFGILVSNFAIGDDHIKPSLEKDPVWVAFIAGLGGAENDEWEVFGFTDCQGSADRNSALRGTRAAALVASLPESARRLVKRIEGGTLKECIATNLNAAGRNLNRSVLIRRIPGRKGPDAPKGATPIGPVKVPGSPPLFCEPIPNNLLGLIEIVSTRRALFAGFLPTVSGVFGPEVANLWQEYLSRPKGASLAPRIFRGSGGRIVDAFKKDPATTDADRKLKSEIKTAASKTPEATVPFTGAQYTSPPIQLGTLLPEASLSKPIRYANPLSIPGFLAAGVSTTGIPDSDAGFDLRLFRGDVRIIREKINGGPKEKKTIKMQIELQVIDAIDFCPGNPGTGLLLAVSIPISRLEATPNALTYDLPFHVFVDLSDTDTLP